MPGEATDIAEQGCNQGAMAGQHGVVTGTHERIGNRRREKALQLCHPLDLTDLALDALVQPRVQGLQFRSLSPDLFGSGFQGTKLADVLDGNDGLRCEGFHQGDLVSYSRTPELLNLRVLTLITGLVFVVILILRALIPNRISVLLT